MITHDQLSEVFDRGLRDGVDTLSPADRALFRIQDFIIEYEMNGLSGYFYNRLPDVKGIHEAVEAMRQNGLSELADLLEEAASLFDGYADPDPPTTWDKVLKKYDPNKRLQTLHKRIGTLRGYGLG